MEQHYNHFQKSQHPAIHREKFVYQDGGTIHLDWSWSKSVSDQLGFETPYSDDIPILIIIPGFTNDSSDIYMQNMVNEAIELGLHTVCIGPRGFQGVG